MSERKTKSLFRCNKGQSMTEYIIIVALIAIACIVVFKTFGEKIGEKTEGITNTLDSEVQVEATTTGGTGGGGTGGGGTGGGGTGGGGTGF